MPILIKNLIMVDKSNIVVYYIICALMWRSFEMGPFRNFASSMCALVVAFVMWGYYRLTILPVLDNEPGD